jgi:hypothetical protein
MIKSLAFAFLCFPAFLWAQPGIPRSVEIALMRVEQAFRTGSPGSIEDLIVSGMTMRIGDSLYRDVSSIKGLELLKSFFSGIDSVSFRFTIMGSGMMIYSVDGRRDTTHVDVWFARSRGEIALHAINISNYPTATIFLDTSWLRHQKK